MISSSSESRRQDEDTRNDRHNETKCGSKPVPILEKYRDDYDSNIDHDIDAEESLRALREPRSLLK